MKFIFVQNIIKKVIIIKTCYASSVNKSINAICVSKDYVNPFKIQGKCGWVNALIIIW